MRKTKIICTLGPATDNEEILEKLILGGMNGARFNFSHGTYEEQDKRMALFKGLREKLKKPVAMILDTKGPEIRLKNFKEGKVHLEKDQVFTLTGRDVEGTNEIVSITYEDLYVLNEEDLIYRLKSVNDSKLLEYFDKFENYDEKMLKNRLLNKKM